MRFTMRAVAAATLAIALAGCESLPQTTSRSSNRQSVEQATYQVVRRLDGKVQGSVDQLNETTAALDARLAEMDVQTRQLMSINQENQVKIAQLQKRLDELTATLYRHFGLSAPSSMGALSSRPMMGTDTVPFMGTVEEDEDTGVVVTPPSSSGNTGSPSAPTAAEPPSQDGTGSSATADYKKARDMYISEDYEQALSLFESYLIWYPESRYASYAQFWKAQCYVKMKQYPEAISAFQKLRDTYPDSPKIPQALCNQGVCYANTGRLDKAVELFEKLVREYPMDAAAETARGYLKQIRGEDE